MFPDEKETSGLAVTDKLQSMKNPRQTAGISYRVSMASTGQAPAAAPTWSVSSGPTSGVKAAAVPPSVMKKTLGQVLAHRPQPIQSPFTWICMGIPPL